MSAFDDREINAFELKFEPGPTITEADKKNDRKYSCSFNVFIAFLLNTKG